MNLKVYSLNEITDSRILYDKNPPRFMVGIVFIVLTLIISFLVWSNNSVKTYMVKGQGIVTSENKVQVMAKVQGSVKEVYMEEGKDVKEGDVLLTLNATESNLQLGQAKSQIEYINRRIGLLARAEEDCKNGTNTFDKNNGEEVEFYNKLNQKVAKAKEYDINEESFKKKGYTDDDIKQYKEQAKVKNNQLYYETLLNFTNEKSQLQFEKSKLEAQQEALEKSKDEYQILAPKSGKFHLSNQITNGMVLQGGTLIGSIATIDENLVVETLLPSTDRPRIHVDDDVELAVGGLNQAEYGTLRGKVESIDEDATIDQEKGNVYFKVKVRPENTFLQDKKGESVNLTLGMVTETRVKYEKITYMKYFLEQIGIKLN